MISSVAFAVCWARSLTSPATTAKPLPSSPARAASIVAFRASRLVCSAIEVIRRTTSPTSALATLSSATWPLVRCATAMPSSATRAAWAALEAISLIEVAICSAPAAMDCTPVLTSSEAVVAAPACCAAPAASASSWELTVVSRAAWPVRAIAAPPIRPPMVSRSRLPAAFSEWAMRDSSSVVCTSTVTVRSPCSSDCRAPVTAWTGPAMRRDRTVPATPMRINRAPLPNRITARVSDAESLVAVLRWVSRARSCASMASSTVRISSITALPLSVSTTLSAAAKPPPPARRSMVSLSSASFDRTSGASSSRRCCWAGLSAVRLRSSCCSAARSSWACW